MKNTKLFVGISLMVQSVAFLVLALVFWGKKKSLAKAFAAVSAAGGVAGAIEKCIRAYYPDTPLQIDHVEGLEDCRKMLLLAKMGRKNGSLIEGMACPGGCVAGAGTNIQIGKAAALVKKTVESSAEAIPPKQLAEIRLE